MGISYINVNACIYAYLWKWEILQNKLQVKRKFYLILLCVVTFFGTKLKKTKHLKNCIGRGLVIGKKTHTVYKSLDGDLAN